MYKTGNYGQRKVCLHRKWPTSQRQVSLMNKSTIIKSIFGTLSFHCQLYYNHRFGKGYTITVRARDKASVNGIKMFLDDVYPGTVVKVNVSVNQIVFLQCHELS